MIPAPSGLPSGTTATDLVFDALYEAVISLKLPPGAKVSEAEIARSYGVSRQPVRDAFFRLSKLGFLNIRPQRATLITKISKAAVRQAAFVRIALESACLAEAMDRATAADLAELDGLIARQKAASDTGDRSEFHRLDDAFHRRICEIAGQGYVWTLIQDHKAHMDRVRFLSLTSSSRKAHDDHVAILAAVKAGDKDEAIRRLREHLSRIHSFLEEIAAQESQYFEEDRV